MRCVESRDQAGLRWLQASDLADAEFASRAEAVRTIEAAHRLSPIPAPESPPVRLRRIQTGRYDTLNGSVTVRRGSPPSRAWVITGDVDGDRVSRMFVASTLHDAAQFIADRRYGAP